MMRSLVSLLTFVAVSTACVSSGKLDPEGYTHERVGYNLAYAQPNEKVFINSSWELEVDDAGNPDQLNGFKRIEVRSLSGFQQVMYVQSLDLVFKHRLTNGAILVQSAPLAESASDKKLPILVNDYVESLHGIFKASLDSKDLLEQKNMVTNIVSSQSGSLGSAETFEAVVDIANAEQLKLNPEHRLLRYKTILIRPKAPDGWKSLREEGKGSKSRYSVIEETYPALIVVTYVMDHAFYDEYLPDFEGFVRRLKLGQATANPK